MTDAKVFGAARYSETFGTYDRPSSLGPVGVRLEIQAPNIVMTDYVSHLMIELKTGTCSYGQGVDGYEQVESREALLATLDAIAKDFQTGCNANGPGVQEVRKQVRESADDIVAAVRHMKQRAIDLEGSTLRCEVRPAPEPSPFPVLPTPNSSTPRCGDHGATIVQGRQPGP